MFIIRYAFVVTCVKPQHVSYQTSLMLLLSYIIDMSIASKCNNHLPRTTCWH